MFKRILLSAVLLFAGFAGTCFAANEFTVKLNGKDIKTVSQAVQLVTGRASDWKKSGVKVEAPVKNKRGIIVRYRHIAKTRSRMRRLPPDTKVIVSARLARTKGIDIPAGQTTATACRHFHERFCEQRLALFNSVQEANGPLPQSITVPAWFTIALPFTSAGQQAQPGPAKQATAPGPVKKPWWFWPLIIGSGLAGAAFALLLARKLFPRFGSLDNPEERNRAGPIFQRQPD